MSLTGVLLADFSAFVKEALGASSAVKGLQQSSTDAAGEMSKLGGAEVTAGIRNVATEVAKVPGPVNDSSSAFKGLSKEIAGTITGFVSAEAIVGTVKGAFEALTGFVYSSVDAYSKQEDASIRLVAALKQHGLATPEVITQYNTLGTTFQNTTKYADDDIQSMEALLTLVGDVMPSQMQGALKAATDLASGLGIDLETATRLVAKAAAGHIETLGKYGITVDTAAFNSRGFAAVLDVINEKFGGQAAAAIDTYSGRVAQAANAWDNVKEALGKIIIEDPLVTAAINHLVTATKDADKASADAKLTIADLAAKMGILDKGTADAYDGLMIWIDALNEEARVLKIIDGLPSPFEKIAKDGQLPAITSGLELNNKLLKEHEEQVKKDAKALEDWQTATDNLAAAQVSWQDTLDTLDGAVAEAIKWDLSIGASQADIATSYGVTKRQVDAVKTSLEEYSSALIGTADFEAAAAKQRDEITKKTTEETNARVIAAMNERLANDAFYASAIEGARKEDAANLAAQASIQQAVRETTNVTQTELDKRLLAAQSNFRAVLNDAKSTQYDLDAAVTASSEAFYQANLKVKADFSETANHISDAFTVSFKKSEQAFNELTSVVVGGSNQMLAGLIAVTNAGTWAEQQRQMFENQMSSGRFFQYLGPAPPPMQTRDSGGPVVAGTPYLIGGGKEPELFVPGASGYVTPNATGVGGVQVTNVFNIVDTEANITRRVSANITRSIMAAQKL